VRGDILLIFVELLEAMLLFGTDDDVDDEAPFATFDDDVVVVIKPEAGLLPLPPPILCVDAD